MEYLSMAGSAILVVLFFGMCVFIHELGHFLVAKWRGLHIVAFSIGFRKIWGKKINGVEYRIGWIPAGGYVDLPQIDTTDTPVDEEGNELPPAKPLDRLLTAFAGPLFNILFGMLLGCVIWIWGMPQESPNFTEIVVNEVIVDSPEYRGGLRPNDAIVAINGREFDLSWKQFTKRILFNLGKVNLTVRRNGELLNVEYLPEANPYVPAEIRREGLAMPFFSPKIPLLVNPMPNSPAAKAGLRENDAILRVNDNAVDSMPEVSFIVAGADGQPVYLDVRHADGTEESINITPCKWSELDDAYADVQPTGQFGFYLTQNDLDKIGLKISGVAAFSPADAAGIQKNDVLLSVNGTVIANFDSFRDSVKDVTAGQSYEFIVDRAGEQVKFDLTPAMLNVYALGVSAEFKVYPSPWKQFTDVVEMSYYSVRNIGVNLANKLNLTEQVSTVSAKNLSGPVGIVKVMYSAFDTSLIMGVFVVVFISFALAITNLLPLPVLDGGHILFAVIELVFRRPLPKSFIKMLSMVFVVLLIGGMAAVTVLDAFRFVPADNTKLDKPQVISIDNPEVKGEVLEDLPAESGVEISEADDVLAK